MTIEKAREILGNRAGYELVHMRKALSTFPILNTDEENERLEAVKVLLSASRKREAKKILKAHDYSTKPVGKIKFF